MKSVHKVFPRRCNWSFYTPHFPAFGLNTEKYFVSLHSQSECRKIRTKKTPNTDSFHTMIVTQDFWFQNSSEICEYRQSRCDSQASLQAKAIKQIKVENKRVYVSTCFRICTKFNHCMKQSLDNIYVSVKNTYS